MTPTDHRRPVAPRPTGQAAPTATTATTAVAVLGFFVVTLDAVVVNVALPTIRQEFGSAITGLQWVVDGYALMFAALLLSAGSAADRFGARRVFTLGLCLFVVASLACGLAPGLDLLVAARFVQGAAAAVMMPASMALIGQAHANPVRRARAVGVWAMGGAVASSTGPVLGGLLTEVSWRLIFWINLPVGLAALVLLVRVAPSPRRPAPLDGTGQVSALVAMGALTYGAIEAGARGFTAPQVLAAFAAAALGLVVFLTAQARGRHPMVPLPLLRTPAVAVSAVIGFAFMVAYYGLPFVFSLYFQQQRGLSPLAAGALFLPMMLIGLVLTPVSARIVERTGHRLPITAGLLVMALGAVALALLPASVPLAVPSALLVLIGLGGPLVMPPTTAVLLNNVAGHSAGTASGVFNTSRQVGGALAIAVYGGLLAGSGGFMAGLRDSLLIAAAVVALAAVAALRLRTTAAARPQEAR
ncbi:MFS transporter [Kineococcus sp. TBRC 1896]|uniref:MFS transporter n=1 Tax=Kineococcus mangrovi TaxID=1660183 RepID=A0ABV4I650_9ACTN